MISPCKTCTHCDRFREVVRDIPLPVANAFEEAASVLQLSPSIGFPPKIELGVAVLNGFETGFALPNIEEPLNPLPNTEPPPPKLGAELVVFSEPCFLLFSGLDITEVLVLPNAPKGELLVPPKTVVPNPRLEGPLLACEDSGFEVGKKLEKLFVLETPLAGCSMADEWSDCLAADPSSTAKLSKLIFGLDSILLASMSWNLRSRLLAFNLDLRFHATL